MISTGRPSSPPFLFTSSFQICMASSAGLPLAESPPVRAMPSPILIGSAARATGLSPTAAMMTSMVTAAASRTRVRFMETSVATYITRREAAMAQARGIKPVGYFDCPGGGQVVVSGRTAYIAHMKAPHGTTIVDVGDPANPRKLAEISLPDGIHSHKVRVMNDVMLVNREGLRGATPGPGARLGRGVCDGSRPDKPREIAFWECKGVHRFTFDGRHAYLSPNLEGYRGNIVGILDLADPTRPQEVGRWWMPGQWIAGGETPTWEGRAHRCHHPMRLGNRLYVSYWHGGFVILDIEDMGKPRFVAGLDWSPPFSTPTHTALPIPFPLQGRRLLLVADEDVMRNAPRRHAGVPLARGHLGRDTPNAVCVVPGRRHRRLGATRVHRLPSAVRGGARHRDSRRVVRPRAAHRGHRQSPRAAGGRLVHPRRRG